MDPSPNNPSTNRLGPGLSEAQVIRAVEESGYPLQTHVAAILHSSPTPKSGGFDVHEEWSYIDRDTNELRSIDLHASTRLYDWDPQPRVRPVLHLLIECKQSHLPYVFFVRRGGRLPDFPIVAGLRQDNVVITSDDDPSSWANTIIQALDLHDDPFQTEPPFCHTFSKCVRKGPEIELSGSDAYNGLVLPLIKAVHHFKQSEAPVETAWYFDCHLTLGVGVIDGPMIAVTVQDGAPVLTGVPWVRVVRHEYRQEADRFDRDQLRVVDVVHKDYFAQFVTKGAIPFAQRFADRVLRHQTELATGQGFAEGMGADSWGNIEARLRPRSVKSRMSRGTAIGHRLLGLFHRSKETS
jgi:hypothetical protein